MDFKKELEYHQQCVKAAKEKYNVGDVVSGKIVARYHYGVYIDIGIGIPALLEIIEIDNLDYTKFLKKKVLKMGEIVTTKIAGFHENEIRLSNKI